MVRKPESGGNVDKTQQADRTIDQKPVDRVLGALGLPLKNVIYERGGRPKIIEKIINSIANLLWEYRPVADRQWADQGPVDDIIERKHCPVKRLQRVIRSIGSGTYGGGEQYQCAQKRSCKPWPVPDERQYRHYRLSPLKALASFPRYWAVRWPTGWGASSRGVSNRCRSSR